MFFYEGQSCPVCGKAFAEEDDIVSCPVCGAPHHRACWMQEGQCHFAEDHGTPRQWVRKTPETEEDEPAPNANRCPNCGTDNPEHAEFCSRCGRALHVEDWSSARDGHSDPRFQNTYSEYAPFRVMIDPLGGVPRNEPFEDATAEELALCVGGNTAYYLPRFRKLKNGSLVQWNWSAFLLAPYWLMYRKQYLAGILAGIAMLVFLSLMVLIFFFSGALGDTVTTDMAVQKIIESGNSNSLMLVAFAMSVMYVAFGLFGNRLYYNSCLKKIRRVRAECTGDFRLALRRAGGVSFLWASLSYFTIEILSRTLPLLLLTFFK